MRYNAHKTYMKKFNPAGTRNERLLWHGTAADALQNINAGGLNTTYCGKNGEISFQT